MLYDINPVVTLNFFTEEELALIYNEVNEKQHPGLYRVLNKFYLETGVPVLLNTSLNIKGQPLLNDEHDIINWENKYNSNIIR